MPFAHNHIETVALETEWTGMVFSDDDRFIALSCSRGIILFDAFSLKEVRLTIVCPPYHLPPFLRCAAATVVSSRARASQITVLHDHPMSSTRPSNAVFSEDGSVVCTGTR